MGARVDYYRRHALEFATLETDQVPLPAPYICPPVRTFADDGEDPLEAWDVTEPELVRLAEGVNPGVAPGSSRLQLPHKRKRVDEAGSSALRWFYLMYPYFICMASEPLVCTKQLLCN